MIGGIESFGLERAISFIRRLPGQLDYANARTINALALRVQSHTEKTLLPQKFTLRTKWYLHGNRFGFNIRFARKDRQEATIGSRAPWLQLQEEGGTKKPQRSKSLSLPTDEARPQKARIIPRQDRPKHLFRQGKAFILDTKAGATLFVRSGDEIKPYYTMEHSARIKPVLTFKKTGEDLIQKHYQDEYNKAFAETIATMKF